MDLKYWNNVSGDYQTEILSVYDNDLEGVVEERIRLAGQGGSDLRAADLGCGVGRFTPLLADVFSEVEACDFSTVGLVKAKRRCRGRKNVSFYQVDLERDPVPFGPVDFAFCANVLLMPSLDKRLRAWRSVANQVVQGGQLLLVLPSLESVQLEFYSAVEARLNEGQGCGEAVRNSIDEKALAADMRFGVHQLDGVRTKHYLKDEIAQMLTELEFAIVESRKVLYPNSEDNGFIPWDWLFLAERK